MTRPTAPHAPSHPHPAARRRPRPWLRGVRRRVLGAATAAAVAAGLTAGGVGAAPVPAYAPVADTTSHVPVRVASYNIHNDASYAAARSAVRRLVSKADVIGLQEFYSPVRVPIMVELATQGWGYWKPLLVGADPVLYDTDVFSFVSGNAVQMTPAIQVEDPKAGMRTTYARPTYATVVRLRHRATDRPVTIVNAHLIARATKDGRPNRRVPRRVEAYKQGMAAVAAAVAREQQSATVYAVGDWNVHYTFDARERVKAFPFRQFKKQGLQSVWRSKRPQRPTINDNGVIDGVWAATAPARAKVLAGFPESDHRPVRAKYRLSVSG